MVLRACLKLQPADDRDDGVQLYWQNVLLKTLMYRAH